MKTRLLLFLFACRACLGQVAYETDLPTAKGKALAQGKWVLAQWCRPQCTECQNEVRVWNVPAISAQINANFVCFSSDIDHDNNAWVPYCQGLSGAGLPIVSVIDPASNSLQVTRVTGYMAAPPFQQYLAMWIRLKGGSTPPPPPKVPTISTNSAGVFVTCTNCLLPVYIGKP